MSKTVELARHLETLHINNMYKNDFYWTWDKTDDEIDAVFTVADALRDLRDAPVGLRQIIDAARKPVTHKVLKRCHAVQPLEHTAALAAADVRR